jgi:hypothetical protein
LFYLVLPTLQRLESIHNANKLDVFWFTRGNLISKGLFGVFNSPKNEWKQFHAQLSIDENGENQLTGCMAVGSKKDGWRI